MNVTENQAFARILREMAEIKERLDRIAPAETPKYLTVAQFAEQEGKSEATVRRWCKEGRVKVVLGARPWRILL